jgi:hypothetical protein
MNPLNLQQLSMLSFMHMPVGGLRSGSGPSHRTPAVAFRVSHDPPNLQVPAIPLLDGQPLTLAWVGTVINAPVKPLGVVNCGETGAVQRRFGKR